MSCDMSNHRGFYMTDRQREILRMALELIADEGYGSLSMRALARACGMKLGALQYHFRTWEDMLRGVVKYISAEFSSRLEAKEGVGNSPTVRAIAEFMLDDTADDGLLSDRLWPQLWAMQQVEPLVSDLLEDVYAEYLQMLESAIAQSRPQATTAEALCLMSLLESESLFAGKGRRWEQERSAMREFILSFIDERYGEQT